MNSFENSITKRHTDIENYLIIFLPKDIANLVAKYDYRFEGKSYTLAGDYDPRYYIWVNPNGPSSCSANRGQQIITRFVSKNSLGNSILGFKIWNLKTGNFDTITTNYESHYYRIDIFLLPDGFSGCFSQWFVTTDYDNKLVIWNTKTGNHDVIGTNHTETIKCVTILSDGRIITGSFDKTLKIWNPFAEYHENDIIQTKKYECDISFVGHTECVNCVIEMFDKRIVSGASDHTLKIWNVQTGNNDITFIGHNGAVYCIKQLPDERIVSGSKDEHLKIWNIKTRNCDVTFKCDHMQIDVKVLSDGRIISGIYTSTLRIWNPSTGNCDATLVDNSGFIQYVVLPDGRIAVKTLSNILKIWDVETGHCDTKFTDCSDTTFVNCISILPDGNLITGSFDGKIKVWY
jgi:WD40 repeat protein